MASASASSSLFPSVRALRPFGCAKLESLFCHQLVHRSAADLLRLLCLLVPLQLLLALFRVPQPDPSLLWLVGSASFGLALALAFAFSSSSSQHPLVPLCALWLCSHPILLLPWPSIFLLPSLLAIYLLYAFFPFPLFSIVLLCFGLSLAQLAAMFTVGSDQFGHAKIIAAFLAHLWVHLLGLYAFLTVLGRKISRAVFLNARNALESERELQTETNRMAKLLSASLPPHIVHSVQQQLANDQIPRVFVEHFGQSSVVFARFYGLPSVLAQLQVSDSVRLLNEFHWRIRAIADSHGILLVPSSHSEVILGLSGVPSTRPDHSSAACQFGADLLAFFQSFCLATSAQLQLRVGIGSGTLSAGIIGSRRWHYDVLGMAIDAAMHLEGICPAGSMLLSEDTWRHLAMDKGNFAAAERLAQGAWQINNPPASASLQSLLFPNPPRRLSSLLTIQQAVLHLLQHPLSSPPPPLPSSSSSILIPSLPATPFTKAAAKSTTTTTTRAKLSPSLLASSRSTGRVGSCRQLDSLFGPFRPPNVRPISLHFVDPRLERTFHAQSDRWLIPGLALCVLFLAIFGLFQALAMPKMFPNLLTLGLALGLMFLLLLALYVNFLESFCQFVTRTALGHSIAVLLVLAALCTCGLASTFSCPLLDPLPPPPFASSSPAGLCRPIQFPALSLALWMLISSVFVRLSSLLLLLVLLASIGLFSIHLFLTHSALYSNDLLARLDLLLLLFAFAFCIFLMARRNELTAPSDGLFGPFEVCGRWAPAGEYFYYLILKLIELTQIKLAKEIEMNLK